MLQFGETKNCRRAWHVIPAQEVNTWIKYWNCCKFVKEELCDDERGLIWKHDTSIFEIFIVCFKMFLYR